MKYLLVLLFLVGCGPSSKERMSNQIDAFASECQDLATCMDSTYSINIKLNSESPLICNIHTRGKKKWYRSYGVTWGTDIEKETPSFGHLSNSISLCKYLKQKGYDSKKNIVESVLFNRCVDKEGKKICWEKMKRGDFYPGDSK